MKNEIATFDSSRPDRSAAAMLGNEDVTDGFLELVGDRVRAARARKNISRKKLSEISGVSQRYLAQLETGAGNISIVLLRRVAEALDYKIEWLVGEEDPYASKLLSLISLYKQATVDQRNRAIEVLDPYHPKQMRANRIAFIGMRGAGKSTLGRLVADELAVPFLELNEEIEQASGMPVNEVMALYGQEGYRRLERQSLERIVATSETIILAVAGGIVAEPETFNYLQRHYHTIWLKADPDDHMSRVRGQGDERPMAGHPEAMDELRNILKSREALYKQAQVAIDTSSRTLTQAKEAVVQAITDKGFLSR